MKASVSVCRASRRGTLFCCARMFPAGARRPTSRTRKTTVRGRRWTMRNQDIGPQQIDLTPTQTQQDIADRDSRRAQSKAVGKARLQSIEQEQAERRATERRRAAASEAESRSLASEVNRRGKIQDQRIRQQQQQLEADQRRRAEEQQALSAAATGRTRLAGCHRPPEMNSRHSSQSSW
jgi:hypothetical protein